MESPAPFNLDDAIRHWRDRFGASALQADDLTELEAHLCATIEELTAKGLNTEEAFLIAAHRLGDFESLAREFAKINTGRIWMIRALWMLAGVLFCQAIVSLANIIGRVVFSAARNILPLGYGHLQRVVGIVAMIGAGSALVWLICSLVLRRAKGAARCADCIVRRPLFGALGLALLLEGLHALEPNARTSTHGISLPNMDRSLRHVWLSLKGVIENIGVGHRPFGIGQLLYVLLQYTPQLILLFVFTLLVLRVVRQGDQAEAKDG